MRGVPEALIKSLSIRDGFIVIKANSTTMPLYVGVYCGFFHFKLYLYTLLQKEHKFV